MIYWPYVFVHASWIVGLSIILAAFSYVDWLRRVSGQPLAIHLESPGWRRSVALGTGLVVIGFCLLPNWHWWLRAPMAGSVAAAGWMAARLTRRGGPSMAAQPDDGPDGP